MGQGGAGELTKQTLEDTPDRGQAVGTVGQAGGWGQGPLGHRPERES